MAKIKYALDDPKKGEIFGFCKGPPFVTQGDTFRCGPVTLANTIKLIRPFSYKKNKKEIDRVLRTGRHGTYDEDFERGLRKFNLNFRRRKKVDFACSPIILSFIWPKEYGKEGHFCTYIGRVKSYYAFLTLNLMTSAPLQLIRMPLVNKLFSKCSGWEIEGNSWIPSL